MASGLENIRVSRCATPPTERGLAAAEPARGRIVRFARGLAGIAPPIEDPWCPLARITREIVDLTRAIEDLTHEIVDRTRHIVDPTRAIQDIARHIDDVKRDIDDITRHLVHSPRDIVDIAFSAPRRKARPGELNCTIRELRFAAITL